MYRKALVTVPAVLLALLATACGGGEQPPQPPAAPQVGTDRSTAPGTGDNGDDAGEDTAAAGDVKITTCAKNAYTQDAHIEVTNSTTQPWKYVVGVKITDTAGGESEARFVKNRIEPGQKVAERIPGDTPLKGEITCTVSEAKRMPAQ